MKSRNIPHYALPCKTKTSNIIDDYNLSKFTVKRKITKDKSARNKVVRINSKIQKDIYAAITMEQTFAPLILSFSSEPNDLLAHELAGVYLYHRLKAKPSLRWQWVNTSNFKESKVNSHCELVFITNVFLNATQGRLQTTRDIITHYNRSMRIVIVAGTNGIDYFDNYLNTSISGMIHLLSRKVSRPYPKTCKPDKKEVLDKVFSPDLSTLLEKFDSISSLK